MSADTTTRQVPVVWLQGAGCSGCSISLLNSAGPRIANVLLQEIVPGKHVNLLFHPTIQAASGKMAVDILLDAEKNRDGYVLAVEGAVPEVVGNIGGVTSDGEELEFKDTVSRLARNAALVLAVGQCATYGGIPAADPNPAGCISVEDALSDADADAPVVHIPGCPPHPDWIIGTVANVILAGLPDEGDIDAVGRPREFFGEAIHENCPRRPDFDAGKFAKSHGDSGCLYELGCKGPFTYADCPLRKWNDGVSWCVEAGSPCLGCAEPGFPDIGPGLYEKIDMENIPRIERDEQTGKLVFNVPSSADEE